MSSFLKIPFDFFFLLLIERKSFSTPDRPWLQGVVGGTTVRVCGCSCDRSLEAGMTKMIRVAGMLWLATVMNGENPHINTVALF